jgi:hypothetical protein
VARNGSGDVIAQTVTLTGATLGGDDKGNYKLNSVNTTTATISPRPITVTADDKTKEYGQPDPGLSAAPTTGNLVGGDTLSGTLTRDAGETVAGSPYAIKRGSLTAGSNYDMSFNNGKLTITPRAISATGGSLTKFLSAPDPALTFTFAPTPLIGTDAFSGSLVRDAGETIGTYPVRKCSLALSSNYTLSYTNGSLKIQYPPATGTGAVASCMGAPNRAILQPVNPDATSVFKKGSTVPLKFRVCDSRGASVGPTAAVPTIITTFERVADIAGNPGSVTEPIDSTTPDTAFRWSATDQQWIFNLSTKNLAIGSYFYKITLNDGTTLPTFGFGVR